MPLFQRYVGIDYSGSGKPTAANRGIKVFSVSGSASPKLVGTQSGIGWSRTALAAWLAAELASDVPTIVGIDHGFSFPDSYFEQSGWLNWRSMVADFFARFPTHERPVREFRAKFPTPKDYRALRLCERWTGSAKSTLNFEIKQGQVATSTHAGIPWLHVLRRKLGKRVCVWPFDRFQPRINRHMIAEVYPSWFKGRVEEFAGENSDERDAFRVCRWLQTRDVSDSLEAYLNLGTHKPIEMALVQREGWILGVL